MQFTYFNTTTSGTTPAPQINTDGRGIVIRKIIVGNPVSAGNITIHNTNVALSNDTTTIVSKITFPTFSTTNVNSNVPVNIDFRASSNTGGSTEEDGLPCGNGGSIVIDQTMQVTVLWDYPESS